VNDVIKSILVLTLLAMIGGLAVAVTKNTIRVPPDAFAVQQTPGTLLRQQSRVSPGAPDTSNHDHAAPDRTTGQRTK
jgi:hypothetical protein